ncbi:MAG: ATP-binding protein [Candidatus Rifleibacteriota bacterium]
MANGNIQARLVFLFFALILLTNGIFALVAVSREKIRLDSDLLEDGIFLGNSMVLPAMDFLLSGDGKNFKNIFENRRRLLAEFKITVYDTNWWYKLGDEARIPKDGFPVIEGDDKVFYKMGTGSISKELFFPVRSDGQVVGAIGIGIPIVDIVESNAAVSDFLLILIINLFIGVVAAIIVSRSILQPLSGLMEGIDAFADGNYALRVETTGQGELRTLCETFNRMAATVQENVKESLLRNRMLDEKLQELWEIYEITRNMSFSLDLKTILERLVEKAATLSFSSNSQIVLQNRSTGRLEAILSGHQIPDVKTEEYENALNSCFLEGNLIERISNDYSIIFVPLLSSRRVQGVLFLAKRDLAGYSEGIRRFLQTIAPVAASMIENARLYEEISEWNNNLKNIMASVNAGLGAFDQKGRMITFNEKFVRFFFDDYSPEVLDTIQEYCHSLHDRIFAGQLEKALTEFLKPQSEESILEHRIRYKTQWHDGNDLVRDFEVRLMPLIEEQQFRGGVIVFDDISEQKKFEKQMVESEKWAVLGKLAASVAHEIRNPLVAIRSLVEIIGDNVSGDLKEHVSVILGEVFRLNRVVTELLSLVRPETAQMQFASINQVLSEMLLLVRHEAARNNIIIRTDIAEESVKILLDTEKIKQAFLNIILNAIQAVGNGGEIEISLKKSADNVRVSFRNNGPAIPADLISKIFEPFFTTKPTGTGLGLAITRKIIELHSGQIEIHSDSDYTEFTFVLPLEIK